MARLSQNMLVFLIAIACACAIGQAEAPAEHIACLVQTAEAGRAVALADLESGNLRRIGPGPDDGAPVWSPEGDRLAFSIRTEAGRAISIASVTDSARLQVASARPWCEEPAWSPDGARVAYTAGAGPGEAAVAAVWSMAEEREEFWGGDTGPEATDGVFALMQPVWLPRLKLPKAAGEGFATSYALLLALDPDTQLEWEGVDTKLLLAEAEEHGALLCIALMRAPGGLNTEIFFVTRTQRVPILPLVPGEFQSFRYSEFCVLPDDNGENLAFESNNGGDRELFVLSRRGLTDVSNHRAADWNPRWSPNGKWLLFESFRGGRRGLYRLFVATTRVDPLVVSDAWDAWGGAWSPDGNSVVFVSDRSGRPRIETLSVKNGTPRPLFDHVDVEWAGAPAWQPEREEE